MAKKIELKGSIVAIVTPMMCDEDVSIDFCGYRKLVEWHYKEGTNGIVVGGTTGEGSTLTHDEFIKLISCTVETVGTRIPVIAGTGTNNTKTTIEKTLAARDAGADAALIVTPYYNKPTQEGLYKHYEAIHSAVKDFPIILYNVPSRTGCDLLPETVSRLSYLSSIVGIKEASGDIKRFTLLEKLCLPDFVLLSGEDQITIQAMSESRRVKGVISVTANVTPKLLSKACCEALEGKIEEAKRTDQRLIKLHKSMFIESNPIPVKFLLHRIGKIRAGIRLPLTPLSQSVECQVIEAWQSV